MTTLKPECHSGILVFSPAPSSDINCANSRF